MEFCIVLMMLFQVLTIVHPQKCTSEQITEYGLSRGVFYNNIDSSQIPIYLLLTEALDPSDLNTDVLLFLWTSSDMLTIKVVSNDALTERCSLSLSCWNLRYPIRPIILDGVIYFFQDINSASYSVLRVSGQI